MRQELLASLKLLPEAVGREPPEGLLVQRSVTCLESF